MTNDLNDHIIKFYQRHAPMSFLSYLENAENMFHKCDYSSLPIRLIVLPIATNRIAHRDYSLVFNV